MRRRLIAALALSVFAIGLSQPQEAAAQLGGAPARRLIRIGFGGGMTVPTSNAADALKSGINGQAYVLFNPGIPLRFNLGYQKFDFKQAVLDGAQSGESQMLSGVAGLTIPLLAIGPLRPYITAGVGGFNIKDVMSAAAGGAEISTSNMRFGVDGGAGLTLKIGRLDAFIEGRVQNVYTEQGAIDVKSIRAIPVTFGILF
jgi:hypothetical protein